MDGQSLLVGGAIGVVLGALGGLLLAQSRARREREALDAQRDEAERALARAQAERDAAQREFQQWKSDAAARQVREDKFRDDQKLAEQSRRNEEIAALKGEFSLLSQAALKLNSEAFSAQALQTFEERRKGFDALLAPLREQLGKLAEGTQVLETKREGAYATLTTQLTSLKEATAAVTRSADVLASAMRTDVRARGRWGELALQNIVQRVGLTEHIDFELQAVQDDIKPDMVIMLPGDGGCIPIDAKASMDAYWQAMDATDLAIRKQALEHHAKLLRQRMTDLAKKKYAGALGARVPLTVMFVPSEASWSAAYEVDPQLFDDALDNHVLIASPVALVGLLNTFAVFWREHSMAENAEEIAKTAKEYHDRLLTFLDAHLRGVGDALEQAVKKWNSAVGSYQRSVLPQGRRLEELKAASGPGTPLPELPMVEPEIRKLPEDRSASEAG
jgi:DNA recombination protein RmuC